MSTISPEQLNSIREQFPALHQEVNCKPLIYLDNGATTQKPKAVINALSRYYEHDNSNVHRGAHTLSDRATEYFENARKTVQRFLNAAKAEEIVWTRGTTEAINLVAATWGRSNIKSGDRILVSGMEHHSNIVPWQMLCEHSGAELLPIPVLENGELDIAAFKTLLTPAVKLVSVVHVSNALGTINPVADIIALAHANGSKVLIDGAQAVAHWDIDVQALDADFYAFSGHKLFGPTGIGVLYGKEALLNAMPPYQGGGEMIEHVSFSKTTYNVLPYKFEATAKLWQPMKMRCWRAPTSWPQKWVASALSVMPPTRPRYSALFLKVRILPTSAPCSTSRVLRYVPAITAPCR